MPSKKNSVLIFEPQMFLKKTLTDQNLTFHLKNMKYSAAYFHMTTCGIFLFFFFLVRGRGEGGVGTLRRSKDVIFHDLGDQLGGPGTPAKMFLALLDGLQELHLDG